MKYAITALLVALLVVAAIAGGGLPVGSILESIVGPLYIPPEELPEDDDPAPSSDWMTDMFNATGGTFVGQPILIPLATSSTGHLISNPGHKDSSKPVTPFETVLVIDEGVVVAWLGECGCACVGVLSYD